MIHKFYSNKDGHELSAFEVIDHINSEKQMKVVVSSIIKIADASSMMRLLGNIEKCFNEEAR